MTSESFQDTLFEDPIGLRFRHAREKSRLTQELVAQQLKLPVAVLDAIEREDWARLGAPIFVRSYVGSYAKLLGLPATLADEVVRGKPAPQLMAIGGSPPARRGLHRGVVRLLYLAATVLAIAGVVMLAVYLQGPRSAAQVLPLDDAALFAHVPSVAGTVAQDVPARTGRRFPSSELTGMTLGAAAANPGADAHATALAPYSDAKVARFTVSSEGTIVPASAD